MKDRSIGRRLARLLPAILAAAALAFAAGHHFSGGARPAPDAGASASASVPLYEDLSEITGRHARNWDARRSDFDEGSPDQAAARREWRLAYDAEMRRAYLRHGREVPRHLGGE